jgi:hypothetical protein
MTLQPSTTPANFYAMPTSHAKATYAGSSATATNSYVLTSDGDNFLTWLATCFSHRLPQQQRVNASTLSKPSTLFSPNTKAAPPNFSTRMPVSGDQPIGPKHACVHEVPTATSPMAPMTCRGLILGWCTSMCMTAKNCIDKASDACEKYKTSPYRYWQPADPMSYPSGRINYLRMARRKFIEASSGCSYCQVEMVVATLLPACLRRRWRNFFESLSHENWLYARNYFEFWAMRYL